ncbi:DUF3488 and transglutaminase-like domain-containing protein [Porticoccaceae bacterium LTM1]|nr:DUF3488 and transglutaminase-like domain-containing protein [Porticoccaceae bacterium LTM1]
MWLWLSQIAILAGLWSATPFWLIAIVAAVSVWRLQIYRGAWNYPSRLVRLLIVACFGAGMLFSFRHLAGLEPFTTLLLGALALKLLETHHRRDALVLVYVGYVAATLQLLFNQSIGAALYVFSCLVMITAALNSIYSASDVSLWKPLKRGASLLLQSLPLMLLLFLVMPRLPAFWTVPGQQSDTTGVSGEMSPGDMTRLGRNGAVAMRVSFEGDVPHARQLYWRGPILTDFDGRRWQQAEPYEFGDGRHVFWPDQKPPEWINKIKVQGEPLSYSVVLEPTQQIWLFALPFAVPSEHKVGLTREMRLVSRDRVTSKTRYEVKSWPQYQGFSNEINRYVRSLTLRLPKGYNPKTLELAQRWRSEVDTDLEYIGKVLDWFHREFTYTLEPPPLNRNRVDEFLWDTQRGFCEHFAGSFTVLMRAAGIPARVVTGYQGGEVHPDGYLLVHQYNAHAWAEVWLAGRGWVRVDPTAAVAPERIELGFEHFFDGSDAFSGDTPFSLSRFRHIGWLNGLRLQLDSINYYWANWVLGYERQQQSLLERLLGGAEHWRIGSFLVGAGILIVIVLALPLFLSRRSRHHRDLADRIFAKLCRKLAKSGIERQPGEGPRSYRTRLELSDDARAKQAARLVGLYERIRYADDTSHLNYFMAGVRSL